ncbi:lasso RiPP family leader peptide-containing protein [Sphingobium yanoikuyae]|nr:lasso RiPP family leader peptide-containing protein [Sphingobium yanoikuyae]
MEKEDYESPELIELGSFEALTQGGAATGLLDAVYPVGTPSSHLLFS